jgi:hypothetical protein
MNKPLVATSKEYRIPVGRRLVPSAVAPPPLPPIRYVIAFVDVVPETVLDVTALGSP